MTRAQAGKQKGKQEQRQEAGSREPGEAQPEDREGEGMRTPRGPGGARGRRWARAHGAFRPRGAFRPSWRQ
jgi:hypothetical protein